MIVLSVQQESTLPFGQGADGRRWFRGLRKLTLRETAEYWHESIFRRHFEPSNRFAYRFEPRTELYREEIKPEEGVGQGKSVDLVLKGKSRRFALAFATFTSPANSATARMKPPKYFTNPFVGSWTDPETGETKTIRRQPDKSKEATAFNRRDRQDLNRFAIRRLQQLMNQTRPVRRKTIKG